MQAKAYATQSATAKFGPFTIERREPGPADVAIDILYCGVCHSDLHIARNEWGGANYPCVPGHEIVGRVSAVGTKVTKVKVGDLAGVGCLVGSCRTCTSCGEGLEQFCETPGGQILTYNSITPDGKNTYGGYSDAIVVDEHFVLRIKHSEKDLAAVAPLLCAGITAWSPLRKWNVGPGQTIGVVGIGGLGHMGIKLARALGARVVAFTTSESTRQDALKLGANEVIVSKDAAAMQAQAGTLDFILNTVAASHNLDAFLNLLKRDGVMVLLGVPSTPHPSPSTRALVRKRRQLAGSIIGGIPETQEMLDFCAERGIVSDVETIAMQDIEKAYERMLQSDVKYRFVIDMATLKAG